MTEKQRSAGLKTLYTQFVSCNKRLQERITKLSEEQAFLQGLLGKWQALTGSEPPPAVTNAAGRTARPAAATAGD